MIDPTGHFGQDFNEADAKSMQEYEDTQMVLDLLQNILDTTEVNEDSREILEYVIATRDVYNVQIVSNNVNEVQGNDKADYQDYLNDAQKNYDLVDSCVEDVFIIAGGYFGGAAFGLTLQLFLE